MKMLSKERTYIYLSLGVILNLLKGESRHSIKLFHYQICNKLDSYHAIYSSQGIAPRPHHSYPMYLKVILQPSPELLYGVMLLPVVDLAYSLLQVDRFPELKFTFEVIPVSPGESLELSELHVDTCETIHPVQGLCYKFTDKRTQSSFVYTGDTAFHPPIAKHAQGASLLIHEASHGPNTSSDRYAHSGSLEAAKIAQLANIQWLALIHCPESLIQKALDVARQIVPDTFLPEDGQTIEIP
jgi:hypothetical protein